MSKTPRFLKFFWRSGTKGVQGINEVAAQEAVEKAIADKKGAFPELEKAKKAKVESRPHSTLKADGRIDPLHTNFLVTSEGDQRITSLHYYPTPLGGRQVWFSKPKYNDGKQANEYFVKDEKSQKKGDGGK